MRRAATTLVIVMSLSTAACGSGDAAAPPAPQTPAVQPQPASAPATTKPVDAGSVVKKLQAADLGLTAVAVQDENTDPNNLLGRPNGYVSRASGELVAGNPQADRYTVDRGLVVEVYGDAEAARNRSEYIQGALKAASLLGSEWHYTTDDGRALVRVTGKVKPSAAKKIEAAVKRL